MYRLILLPLLLTGGLNAAPVLFSVSLSVNGQSGNGTFNIMQEPNGDYDFYVSLDGVTVTGVASPDPVIDFGMSFSNGGDPTVQFSLTTPYSGGPYTNLLSTTDGTLNALSGDASVTPLAGQTYIQTVNVLDGSSNVVTTLQQNIGCSTMLVEDVQCPISSQTQTTGAFGAAGGLQVEENFILSAGDGYNVNGTATLSNGTPEPASAVLLVTGILAMAALARRRAKAR